jgi:hypothetical protein
MSTEGEKCLELVLFDGSNYDSWCISILHNFEAFNLYLLSNVDSSICLLNITWANLSEEERKCLKLNAQAICLLTHSLSPNVEALIIKEHAFPMDAHLLWKSSDMSSLGHTNLPQQPQYSGISAHKYNPQSSLSN